MSNQAMNILITGANRGIGRGLAESFLSRPNHTVVAAVRDVDSTTLKDYNTAEGSKLLLVKIENESATDPATAMQQIKDAGIVHLDLVIANAGICPTSAYRRVEEMDLVQLRQIFEVNTFSFVPLFKAVQPLLHAAATAKGLGKAKLLVISSNAAQLADMGLTSRVMLGTYGSSKAALNYLVRRTHFENPWLTSWVMNPGFVQTENGKATAKFLGMQDAPHTLDESLKSIVKKVDEATREETSGNFYNYNGIKLTY